MKIVEAEILSNRTLSNGIWQLHFLAPEIAMSYSGAGQFVSILTGDGWEHPLRRPMSIAGVEQDRIAIIYKPIGPVTRSLATMTEGQTISVLGPLGNTFTHWDKADIHPVLVGGGVGLAPILNLHGECTGQSQETTLIIGARTADEHFIEHDPKRKVYLTTDDGSMGNPGTVMPTLIEQLRSLPNAVVFSCGPEPMLKAIRNHVLEKNIPTQLSVESYMGCGLGMCQSCVIEKSKFKSGNHSYHERFSLVCKEGPVFPAQEVILG